MQLVLDANGRVIGSTGSVIAPFPDPALLDAETSYGEACSRHGEGAETLAKALAGADGDHENERFARPGEAARGAYPDPYARSERVPVDRLRDFNAHQSGAYARASAREAVRPARTLADGLPGAPRDLRVRYVNRKSEELFGYTREEMVGHEPFSLIVESGVVDFVREVFKPAGAGRDQRAELR